MNERQPTNATTMTTASSTPMTSSAVAENVHSLMIASRPS